MKKVLCAIAIGIMLALSASAAVPFDFGDGVIYYGFDNQAVSDGGSIGLDGGLVGGNISFVNGLNGGCAVKMDSDSYISIPVEATYSAESMSVIVWFKTDHINGAWNRIISTGVWGEQAAPGILIGIFRDAASSADYVAVGIGADDASKNHWNLIGAPEEEKSYQFDDDKWHCLGYTVGEGSGALYLDGAQIYSFEYSAADCSVETYEETACIGGFLYYNNLNEPYSGTIDEVYFIPKVVDADTMKAYYDAESQGKIIHTVSDPPETDELQTSGEDSTDESEANSTDEITSTSGGESSPLEGDSDTTDNTDIETDVVTDDHQSAGDKNTVYIIATAVAAAIVVAIIVIILMKKKHC